MRNARKAEFVAEFGELLRKGQATNVQALELSEDGNTVTITWLDGSPRAVQVGGDSDAALILDVIRKVLY
jgi:hypothetical protein